MDFPVWSTIAAVMGIITFITGIGIWLNKQSATSKENSEHLEIIAENMAKVSQSQKETVKILDKLDKRMEEHEKENVRAHTKLETKLGMKEE